MNRNKKINVYSCKPQFYCIKVGFNRVKTVQACFLDEVLPIVLSVKDLFLDAFSFNNLPLVIVILQVTHISYNVRKRTF